MPYTGAKPVDPLILSIAPESGDGTADYTLYEDGSDGRKYETGEFARTPLHSVQHGSELHVTMDAAQGSYPGMLTQRAVELRLPGDWPPASVTANGTPLNWNPQVLRNSTATGWAYIGNTLTTVVRTGEFPTSTPVEIVVMRDPALVSQRSELFGFAGAMTRLRAAYDTLNSTWPLGWSPDSLIDVMQTGDRLGYHPENAAKELAHFHATLATAQTDVGNVAKQEDEEHQKQIAARVGVDWKSDAAQKRVADMNGLRQRAIAQMQSAVEIVTRPAAQ